MRSIISFVFCFICFYSFSKDKKVLTLDYHQTNFISFEFDYGGKFCKSAINTGFLAENGSQVTYFPGSGIQGKFSVNYFNGERWTYGVTYSIQSGGLNKEYENGSGDNSVEIVTPTIRYAPLILQKNKSKINIGIGMDAVISNSLKVHAKMPMEVNAVYNYKKSFGPTLLLEYQNNFSRHFGVRIGVSAHQLKNELESFQFNSQTYDAQLAPLGVTNRTVFNPNAYFGFFVFL